MDEFLNVAFFAFHTLWIAFNCVGWLWRQTRPIHLITVGLTAASWLGLGAYYGWGYCPCTDWHWQVRARLGYSDPASYTQLLIHVLSGIELRQRDADAITAAVFILVTVLTIALNVRDRRRRSTALV